ncbi:MAG: endolytic transglycosylase MltG [Candidatus Omnitrophica bacterium]|nr:endolytic transglycosylase MltG [Candidatus Omnitrophota bacterium]
MKKKLIISSIIIIGGFIIIFFLIFIQSLYGTSDIKKLVDIPPGLTAQEIANLLYKENIIKNKSFFIFLSKKNSLDKKLKAGTYEFNKRPFIENVLKKLIKGEIAYLKITIPPGSTCKDIGKILENYNVCSERSFNDMCKKYKLEGFLFPDTYYFPLKVSKKVVARKMISTFWNEIKTLYPAVKKITPQKLKKIVIIASIIEKEAGPDNEKPLIASVFYNRLKIGMPLQSDVTIMYIMKNQEKAPTPSDLKIISPYNTYIYKGLPPTPICNPGIISLKAAIFPAKTNYLYFASRGNDTSYFAKNYHDFLIKQEHYYNLENKESDTNISNK